MKYALNLASDGRILSATYAKYATSNAECTDMLPVGDINDYCYINGDYLFEPLTISNETLEIKEINKLKQCLAETDYRAIKYAEGELTAEEYLPIKLKREEWRAEITRLGG